MAINSEPKEFNRMSNRRPLFSQVEAALVSDGEEEIETVSIKNALESLDNVFNFLVHPPAGLIAMQVLYQRYAPYENKC